MRLKHYKLEYHKFLVPGKLGPCLFAGVERRAAEVTGVTAHHRPLCMLCLPGTNAAQIFVFDPEGLRLVSRACNILCRAGLAPAMKLWPHAMSALGGWDRCNIHHHSCRERHRDGRGLRGDCGVAGRQGARALMRPSWPTDRDELQASPLPSACTQVAQLDSRMQSMQRLHHHIASGHGKRACS